MPRFLLNLIKNRPNFGNIKRSVYGNLAGASLSMLVPRLDKIVKGLNEGLINGKIDEKTMTDLNDIYNQQCIKNKSFKTGYDNFVGDKILFKKTTAYFDEFEKHKSFLEDRDKEFITRTLIPFIHSLKSQLMSEMFEKVYK